MKNQKKFPLMILAYSRPKHLSKTLEALFLQRNLKDHDIYFFVDGLKAKVSQKMKKKHQEVQTLIEQFQGGHSVTRKFSEQNQGVFESFRKASEFVLQHHEGLIYLEEDIIPAHPAMLDYMNTALLRYEKDPSVYAINGFCFGELSPMAPVEGFFSYRFCPWGFGTWKDRLQNVVWDLSNLGMKKFSPWFWWRFQRASWGWGWTLFAYTFLPFLRKSIQPWDILFCLHHYLHGRLSYFPAQSFVINAGDDGSGMHKQASFQRTPLSSIDSENNICFPFHIELNSKQNARMAKRMIPIFRYKAFLTGWAWLKRKGAFWKRESIS